MTVGEEGSTISAVLQGAGGHWVFLGSGIGQQSQTAIILSPRPFMQAVKEQANRREIKEQLDLSRKLREDKFERNMKSVMVAGPCSLSVPANSC